MPRSVVCKAPSFKTQPWTLRTSTSPTAMRPMTTGATRATPLAVLDTAGEFAVERLDAGAPSVVIRQRDRTGAGVDHHVDGAAVDLRLGHVVTVAGGAQFDAAPAPAAVHDAVVRIRRHLARLMPRKMDAGQGQGLIAMNDKDSPETQDDHNRDGIANDLVPRNRRHNGAPARRNGRSGDAPGTRRLRSADQIRSVR